MRPQEASSRRLLALVATGQCVALVLIASVASTTYANQNSSIAIGHEAAILNQHHHMNQALVVPREDEPVAVTKKQITAKSATSTTKTTSSNNNHDLTSSLSSSMLRAYIRTNSMRAYHLDLHSYREEEIFSGDAKYVDSKNEEHQKRCGRHLEHYNRLLKSVHDTDPMDGGLSMESLRLADMFGRPPSGLLEGNQFWLGTYDNCVEHKLELEDQDNDNEHKQQQQQQYEPVKSQYCLGLAQFPSWNPRDTKTSIKVGLCLPETCTNAMLNDNNNVNLLSDGKQRTNNNIDLVEQMMKYQFGGDRSQFGKLKLRSVYCLPHETSKFRQFSLSAKLLIGLLGFFGLMCAWATVYDYLNNKLEREKNELVGRREIATEMTEGGANKRTVRMVLVEGFSLIRNIEKFMKVDQSPRTSHPSTNALIQRQRQSQDQEDNNFEFDKDVFSTSITGLKCLGLIWIIAAHTFLVSPIPSSNLVDLDKMTSTMVANIFLTAHLMVDTFFALSGVLASYLIFKSDISKLRQSHWIIMTIHRYWRLTPVYLICYWFTKSLGHLLNSGPLWDFGTAQVSPRYQCEQESWAEALLHLSDFKSPKEHCVPFAWFIANGIKFWLVTPFLLTVIQKSMRRGYQLMGLLIVANMALVAKLAFSSNVDMKSVLEFKPESAENMLNNMDQVYTRPYSRIGAYLVGLLAGHYFYRIETKQIEVKLSKNMKIIMWTLFTITTIVMTFLLKLANGLPIDDSALPYVFSVSSALIRPLWALCTCWLVFALAHGQARWLARFLSGNIWKILGKLSFCAYLAQGEIIAHLYLAQSHSNAFTYVDLVTRPIVATVLTMLASVVMLLLIEYPLIGIEELVLPAKKPKTKVQTTLEQQQQQQQQQQLSDKLPNGDNQAKAFTLIDGQKQQMPNDNPARDKESFSGKLKMS